MTRIDFHSHHEILEILLSLGIIGVLMFLKIPYRMIKISPLPILPYALVFLWLWIGTLSTWFVMPTCLPFLALGLGILERFLPQNSLRTGPEVFPHSKIFKNLQKISSRYSYKILISFFTLTILLFFVIKQALCIFSYPSFPGTVYRRSLDRPGYYETTGMHLANYISELIAHHPSNNITTLQSCLDQAWKMPNPPTLLLISMIRTLDALRSSKQDLSPALSLKICDQLVKQAPHRVDLVLNTILSLPPKQQRDWLDKHKLFLGKDPLFMWLTGLIFMNTPHKESEGLSYLRNALLQQVDRWIPIAKSLKAKIMKG
jgi:hypothetical protein